MLRKIFAVLLLAPAAFCAFGYLASGELQDSAERLPWQIGYGAVGALCLLTAGLLMFARSRPAPPKESGRTAS